MNQAPWNLVRYSLIELNWIDTYNLGLYIFESLYQRIRGAQLAQNSIESSTSLFKWISLVCITTIKACKLKWFMIFFQFETGIRANLKCWFFCTWINLVVELYCIITEMVANCWMFTFFARFYSKQHQFCVIFHN